MESKLEPTGSQIYSLSTPYSMESNFAIIRNFAILKVLNLLVSYLQVYAHTEGVN